MNIVFKIYLLGVFISLIMSVPFVVLRIYKISKAKQFDLLGFLSYLGFRFLISWLSWVNIYLTLVRLTNPVKKGGRR